MGFTSTWIVIDKDGNVMEGVAVYGGNKQTTTNNQGQYYLTTFKVKRLVFFFQLRDIRTLVYGWTL